MVQLKSLQTRHLGLREDHLNPILCCKCENPPDWIWKEFGLRCLSPVGSRWYPKPPFPTHRLLWAPSRVHPACARLPPGSGLGSPKLLSFGLWNFGHFRSWDWIEVIEDWGKSMTSWDWDLKRDVSFMLLRLDWDDSGHIPTPCGHHSTDFACSSFGRQKIFWEFFLSTAWVVFVGPGPCFLYSLILGGIRNDSEIGNSMKWSGLNPRTGPRNPFRLSDG